MEQKESPEMNPHLYNQFIFGRGSKYILWAKIVYSMNGVGKIGQICAEK